MDRTQRKRSTSRGCAARAVARVACAALVVVALWPAPAPAGEADASPVPAARAPEPAAPAAPDPEAGPGTPDPGPDSGPDIVGPEAGPGAPDAVQEDAAQRSEADGSLVGAPAPQPDGSLGAEPRANSDPAGFSWKWVVDPDNQNGVRINAYDYNGIGNGLINVGTVHVPATLGGKPVTSIAGGNGIYNNLQCSIDFTGAVNLEKIMPSAFQMGSEVKGYGPRGAIDLSRTKLVEIPRNAFYKAAGITGLALPPTVKSIGENAFYLCKLTGALVLPSALESIGQQAFYGGISAQGCQLTSLLGLESTKLVTVGTKAFFNNDIAGSLSFPSSLSMVNAEAFQKNRITKVTFGSSKKVELMDSCFRDNSIQVSPFGDTTKFTLGRYVFAGNALTGTISFLNDMTPIPSVGIIADNPQVNGVVVSPAWAYIPDYAFSGLTELKTVDIPDNALLKRVGNYAFQNCVNLDTIDFKGAPLQNDGQGNSAIGMGAFKGCYSPDPAFPDDPKKGTGLTKVVIGAGRYDSTMVTVPVTVASDAFEGCGKLYSIDIPQSSDRQKMEVRVGDRAFKGTNLGAFPNPDAPLGYLPLDRRGLVSIGANAFENANISDVRLPSTLRSVGAGAFAGNHIPYLELPNNAALDAGVGANVLADQTLPEGTVMYEGTSDAVGDVRLDALESGYGVPVSHLTSVALELADGSTEDPSNGDWQTSGQATFAGDSLRAPGTRFSYGMNVYRRGSATPVSAGSMVLGKVEEGVPYEFLYYDSPGYQPTDRHDSFNQWVAVGSTPQEVLHGVPNYGFAKPGYRTDNAKWKHKGAFADPSTVVAVGDDAPSFSSYWIANSYSVSFDDGWDFQVRVDGALGMTDPSDPTAIVRNPKYVSGSTGPVQGLSYGEPADLPANAFKMGGYAFDGWATSPGLAADDRVQDSNYFAPGTQISTPDPAPADGGELTLYAQWRKVDYGADDPALLGFLSIPSSLSLEPYGGFVWSAPSDPSAPAGDRGVVVAAAPEGPGATWPSDTVYHVSVARPSPGAPLLSLSLPGGGGTRAFQVLDASGSVYDPGGGPAPAPLMVIDPHDPAAASGSFSLRSVDPVGSFLANARYSGTMEFRVDTVPATTREVAP